MQTRRVWFPDPNSVARDSRLPGCRLPESLQALLFKVLRRQGVIGQILNSKLEKCAPLRRISAVLVTDKSAPVPEYLKKVSPLYLELLQE
eukprot:12415285-Karenia_brevis.AAC.1